MKNEKFSMKNMKRIIFCLFFLTCSIILSAQSKKAVPIIFDSDMGPDYDDVGAIAMLHAFADNGDAKILATMASTKYECVACVFSVFNNYFKRNEIPIGVPKGNAVMLRDVQHWTDSISAKYPHKINSNDDAEDAVELYRKILSAQPAHSVTIVTTGFLTNLSALLKTGKDKYSGLDGKSLVAEKVKQLVCMAGRFPEGYEFNVDKDIPASQNVFDNWPTNIIFSGFEIGMKIKVGLPLIHNEEIKNSPVKDVFRISIPLAKEDSLGRMSWDETAVFIAVKGFEPYYTLQFGKIKVADDGKDSWLNETKTRSYLIESEDPKKVEALINKLITHQPK
ncbi:MAG TPA: nucleoside hydrolase [Puia sp.]|jgi:inosine-uridine nucleoside N-ribohydrolase|nr:nucleoside hydrolase [Puia sp.]